jgi:hypothetical protein
MSGDTPKDTDSTGKNGIIALLKKPILTVLGASAAAALLSGESFVDAATAMNGGLGAALGAYAGGYTSYTWAPWVGAVAIPALVGGQIDATTIGSGIAAGAIYTQL